MVLRIINSLVHDSPRDHIVWSFELPIEESRAEGSLSIGLIHRILTESISDGVARWNHPSSTLELDSNVRESLVHSLKVAFFFGVNNALWEPKLHRGCKHFHALMGPRVSWVHAFTLLLQIREQPLFIQVVIVQEIKSLGYVPSFLHRLLRSALHHLILSNRVWHRLRLRSNIGSRLHSKS